MLFFWISALIKKLYGYSPDLSSTFQTFEREAVTKQLLTLDKTVIGTSQNSAPFIVFDKTLYAAKKNMVRREGCAVGTRAP